MASLINRIQRAFLGSAGPEKVRALLAELAIPASGSGGNMREIRRGFLRSISDEAILRDALANIGLSGGGGGGAQSLSSIRNAVLLNLRDSEVVLREGLNGLLEPNDLGGEGGGGGPEWVPPNAKIHIDLVGGDPQGRAWVDGAGEVAVDTLLGTDSNAGNVSGDLGYNPANLTPRGLKMAGAGTSSTEGLFPCFIGPALTVLMSGATVRIRWYGPDSSGSGDVLEICSADGSNVLEYYYTKTVDATPPDRWFRAESWAGGYGTVTIDNIINAGTADSLNSFALTVTSTRSEIAVNGSAVEAGVLIPATHWNDLVAVVMGLGANDTLTDITIYDPLPDTTGLSELSVP